MPSDLTILALGATGSLLAGLASAVGALPIYFLKTVTRRLQGALLGFGAGVMLAATSFSLIVPGIEAAKEATGSEGLAALQMSLGIALGGAFLWATHRWFPHEHFFKGPEGADAANLARIWLFVTAIALHNFPEGLAVGVSFGDGSPDRGIAIATGIGLQNIPEGLVTALALLAENYTRNAAFGVALLTGLIEPLGGLVGAGVVAVARSLLPWGLAFAAGAMLFVISGEIIPESHSRGCENEGTIGTVVGFILMMVLDITLG